MTICHSKSLLVNARYKISNSSSVLQIPKPKKSHISTIYSPLFKPSSFHSSLAEEINIGACSSGLSFGRGKI